MARRGQALGAGREGVRAGATRPILAACIVLALASLLFHSTLAYDPWWWVIWGREVAHLDLSTRGGPSWKPLPVIFTSVFSVLGDAAPTFWLVVGRTGCLLAAAMAYRLGRRLAGPLAGAAGVVALALATGWIQEFRNGESEGLVAGLALWAVNCHLDGRRDQALAVAFAASLLRPDVWPFFGAYAIVAWIRDPPLRPRVALLVALIPALWLLPELWGSGDPLRASSRARLGQPEPGTAGLEPVRAVLRYANASVILPVKFGAVAAVVLAWFRRQRAVLALAIGVGAWICVLAAMALAGYPAINRFLIPVSAPLCVLAGVGLAGLVGLAGSRPLRTVAAAVLLALSLPFAVARARALVKRERKTTFQVRLDRDLHRVLDRVGGARAVRACGHPSTGDYKAPVLMWYLHSRDVRYRTRPPVVIFQSPPGRGVSPLPRLRSRRPGLALVARAGPWRVYAACRAGRRLHAGGGDSAGLRPASVEGILQSSR